MSKQTNAFQKWKPAAPKIWLFSLSGVMWSGVGVMLCSMAYSWLKPLPITSALVLALAGIILAVIISTYGFSGLAVKNICRISNIPGRKICIFAFQAWSSYPLVVFMITLGIMLRKFSPIPKSWLAVLYIGIGGGLFLASLQYYRHLSRKSKGTP